MIVAVHDWYHPIWDHGPSKGRPTAKPRCRRCNIWQTKWNKNTTCPLTPAP